MKYTDIQKKQINGIRARLAQATKKYGFDEVRLVSNRFFNEALERQKLNKEIREKEKELMRLRGTK